MVHVSDEGEFLALGDAWNTLVGDRSVFLRHEWFDAAWQWRRLDEETRLAIRCFYRGKDLVGICPLIARIERGLGMRRRVLEFLTVPDTQACDIIAAAQERGPVADALAAELAARNGEWDLLHLAYLPEQALSAMELTRALAKRGVSHHASAAGANPFVRLDANWGDYYAVRSRRLKKSNKAAANRLKKAGEMRVRWLQPGLASTADARSATDAVIAISARSWKRSTGNSLDYPGPQAFIRRLTEAAVRQGWLSLWFLTLDGRNIAMEYQLAFDGNVYTLRADIVEDCEELSPGSYLHRHQLEQLFGRGWQRYLMGHGDNQYKTRWSEGAEPLFRLDAYSTSAQGRLTALWERRLKPALRALRATFAVK